MNNSVLWRKVFINLLLASAIILILVNGRLIITSVIVKTIVTCLILYFLYNIIDYSTSFKRYSIRVITTIFSITMFAICLLGLLIFIIFNVDQILDPGKTDPGFECINQISHENNPIKVYRTNGGATTAYGIVVRKEYFLLPGLIWVDDYFYKYRLDTIGINITSKNHLILRDVMHDNIILKEIDLR